MNCVAIPIHLDGSSTPSGAISVSAVTFRFPLERLVEVVPEIRETTARMLGLKVLAQLFCRASFGALPRDAMREGPPLLRFFSRNAWRHWHGSERPIIVRSPPTQRALRCPR